MAKAETDKARPAPTRYSMHFPRCVDVPQNGTATVARRNANALPGREICDALQPSARPRFVRSELLSKKRGERPFLRIYLESVHVEDECREEKEGQNA